MNKANAIGNELIRRSGRLAAQEKHLSLLTYDAKKKPLFAIKQILIRRTNFVEEVTIQLSNSKAMLDKAQVILREGIVIQVGKPAPLQYALVLGRSIPVPKDDKEVKQLKQAIAARTSELKYEVESLKTKLQIAQNLLKKSIKKWQCAMKVEDERSRLLRVIAAMRKSITDLGRRRAQTVLDRALVEKPPILYGDINLAGGMAESRPSADRHE